MTATEYRTITAIADIIIDLLPALPTPEHYCVIAERIKTMQSPELIDLEGILSTLDEDMPYIEYHANPTYKTAIEHMFDLRETLTN